MANETRVRELLPVPVGPVVTKPSPKTIYQILVAARSLFRRQNIMFVCDFSVYLFEAQVKTVIFVLTVFSTLYMLVNVFCR